MGDDLPQITGPEGVKDSVGEVSVKLLVHRLSVWKIFEDIPVSIKSIPEVLHRELLVLGYGAAYHLFYCKVMLLSV